MTTRSTAFALRVLAASSVFLLAACGRKPVEIRLTPMKSTIYGFGKSLPLKAVIADKKGEPMPDLNPAWESSSPKVADVNAAGSVRSVSAGKAVVTAKFEELSAKANIEVVDVSAVTITPVRATLAGAKGLRSEFVAEIRDSKGTLLNLPLTWESSDPKVVTVDAKGGVVSVGEGRANITVALGDMAAVAEVKVTFREIAAFEAAPMMLLLKSGETQHVQALAKDAAGNAIEDAAVAWTSDDPRVARVLNGYITGVGPGSTTIRAQIGTRQVAVSALVN